MILIVWVNLIAFYSSFIFVGFHKVENFKSKEYKHFYFCCLVRSFASILAIA